MTRHPPTRDIAVKVPRDGSKCDVVHVIRNCPNAATAIGTVSKRTGTERAELSFVNLVEYDYTERRVFGER